MSIETDKFDALYKRLKPHGVTMTALLSKAVGVALARHPVMFASEWAPRGMWAGVWQGMMGAYCPIMLASEWLLLGSWGRGRRGVCQRGPCTADPSASGL
jgi:hypothetical protein